MSRGESILRQVAATIPHVSHLEDHIGCSDELPSEVVRQIADSADRVAALECWREMMHAAVDAVAESWKNVM